MTVLDLTTDELEELVLLPEGETHTNSWQLDDWYLGWLQTQNPAEFDRLSAHRGRHVLWRTR